MSTQRLSVYQIIIILSSIVLVIFPLAVFGVGEMDTLKNQISQKQEEIKKLEEQAKEYQQTIKQKQSEAQTLKNRISLYDAEIGRLNVEIRLTESKIEEMILQIYELEINIQGHEKNLKTQKIRLGEIVRAINNYDNADFFELLLKTNDFSEILNQAGYMDTLQQETQENVRTVKELKRQLGEEKIGLQDQKNKTEALKSELGSQKDMQTKQKQDQQGLLTKTQKSEQKYQNLLEETEEKQRQTEREIFDLEDALKRALDPSKVPTARPGVLSWPAEGLLTQGYGCVETKFAKRLYPDCNNGKGGFHNGVDIASGRGTQIFAARDGKVIASGSAPYAYGNWISVEHDNGLVTLYTHLASKKVSIGDNVIREKTLIGYMGTTGLSTGIHLHFTVYAPGTFKTQTSKISGILPIGATLNPMDYL